MWFFTEGKVIDEATQREMMRTLVCEAKKRISPNIRKVLILPPDITRCHSGSGDLTNELYHIFEGCTVDVIPTLGQHVPHTPSENRWMFGDVPEERIHVHDWKTSAVKIGEIDGEFVRIATDGKADWPIPIEVNRAVVNGEYDLIINIGQVVPHEVLGFANHNKNYFIGLGGKNAITQSHMMAALCGIENNLAQLITPLRGCFNMAEEEYLGKLPDLYVQIVKTRDENGDLQTTGLYVGEGVDVYIAASRYAREHTVHMFEKPIKKVICYMDGKEFRSTWVANKAIYRTRKVIADGGDLIVIAPGVERFGEQAEVDAMIRKYGYKGTPNTLKAYAADPVLHDLAHASAHLIHGSTEGRFNVTYAPSDKLSKEEIESIGYNYLSLDEAMKRYDVANLKDGFNTVNGEEVYYISSPSIGLWTAKSKYVEALKNNNTFVDLMIERRPDDALWRQIREWNDADIAALTE